MIEKSKLMCVNIDSLGYSMANLSIIVQTQFSLLIMHADLTPTFLFLHY